MTVFRPRERISWRFRWMVLLYWCMLPSINCNHITSPRPLPSKIWLIYPFPTTLHCLFPLYDITAASSHYRGLAGLGKGPFMCSCSNFPSVNEEGQTNCSWGERSVGLFTQKDFFCPVMTSYFCWIPGPSALCPSSLTSGTIGDLGSNPNAISNIKHLDYQYLVCQYVLGFCCHLSI